MDYFQLIMLSKGMPHEKPLSALVQAMAWCIFTTKPLPELMFITSKTILSLHEVSRCKFYKLQQENYG